MTGGYVAARPASPAAARNRRQPRARVRWLARASGQISGRAGAAGHIGTVVTEQVYRHQVRPGMAEAATAVDDIFERRSRES